MKHHRTNSTTCTKEYENNKDERQVGETRVKIHGKKSRTNRKNNTKKIKEARQVVNQGMTTSVKNTW